MKKKSTNLASEALSEMKDIKNALKNESKDTLKTILAEAMKDALSDSVLDEEEEEEPEIESPVDDKSGKKKASKHKGDLKEDDMEKPEQEQAPMNQPSAEEQMPAQEQEPVQEPVDGEDEWAQFSQYQTGDQNTYDLTSEKDMGQVLKVYKLLNDTDNVAVVQDGNKVKLTDNDNGAEYVIELEGEDMPEEPVGEEMPEEELNEGTIFEISDDEDFDFVSSDDLDSDSDDYLSDDDEDEEEDYEDIDVDKIGFEDDVDIDLDDDSSAYGSEDVDTDDLLSGWNKFDDEDDSPAGFDDFDLYENKRHKTRKKMKEGKNKNNEILFEVDLGYTDNYQGKDPIKGLSNSEPSKSGKSWHKGVPTGTEKPWAGETKSKGNPFKNTKHVSGSVNEEEEPMTDEPAGFDEIEEGTNVGGAVQQRTSSKSHIPAGRKEFGPKVKRHVSAEGEYNEMIQEMAKIKKENKQLKEAITSVRKSLNEAYVTNVNLGKITKLFVENTTTQEEKRNIVSRFASEAKTVEQSKSLYESIKKQLNENVSTAKTINESSMNVKGSAINESKNIPSTFNGMIDLINRMGNY